MNKNEIILCFLLFIVDVSPDRIVNRVIYWYKGFVAEASLLLASLLAHVGVLPHSLGDGSHLQIQRIISPRLTRIPTRVSAPRQLMSTVRLSTHM